MEIFLISGTIIKQHACLCRQEYQKKKKTARTKKT